MVNVKVDKLFYELIQVALGHREKLSHEPTEGDWIELFEIAEKQAVSGMAIAALETLSQNGQKPPLDLLYEWIGMSEQIKAENQRLNKCCQKLQKMFAEAGVRTSILKGQGIAQYYDEPLRELRQSGDIDIFVDCGRERPSGREFSETQLPFLCPPHDLHNALSNLFRGGNDAAALAHEFHGLLAVDGQANVLHHLAVGDFHRQRPLDGVLGNDVVDLLAGEGPQGDGPHQAALDAFFRQNADSSLADAGHGAVGTEHELGALGLVGFHHDLVLANLVIAGVEPGHQVVQHLGLDVQGVDDGPGTVPLGIPALAGPGLIGHGGIVVHLQLHRLHHLADEAVRQDDDGGAVLVGGVKGLGHQITGLLDGRGGVDHAVVIAVAAALGGLEVVALGGLDIAEAGAAAHHVDDNAGDLRGSAGGNAFLLQGDSGGGRGGHGSGAGAARAVDHVDGRQLRFGLQEAAAYLGHPAGHVLGNIVLRGDGIAEEKAAARLDCGFGNGLATLHQFLSHTRFLLISR